MAAKTGDLDPDAYLARAIARYPAPIADTATRAMRKLRARFPGARVLVYDRRQSLPIAFAAASGGPGLFSLVLYPRWVRFFFLEGASLDDREGRLEGEGNQVRSIRLEGDADTLDEAYIKKLMNQALKLAAADLKTGRGEVVIKSMLTTPSPSAKAAPATSRRKSRVSRA